MDNEEIKAQASDTNGGSDGEISRLLRGLPRAEAPADFDLRLRGRIADRRLSKPGGFRFPIAVRNAVGAFAILLIVAVAGGVWLYSGKNAAVSDVAVVEPGAKPANIGSPSNNEVAIPPADSDGERAAVTTPAADNSVRPGGKASERTDANASADSDRPGDSIESSSREATRILPKGINPNPATSTKPGDFDRSAHIKAEDVLTLLGMNGAYSGNGWLVSSVTTNSAAQRLGVRAGDVVEAINDQAITEKTSFAGSFSGKSLRVRRGGQVLRIDLAKK